MSSTQQNNGIVLTVAAILAFIALIVVMFIHGLNKPRIMTTSDLRNNGAFLFDKPRAFKAFNLIFQTYPGRQENNGNSRRFRVGF